MAWEIELILRFDTEFPPEKEEIEEAMDCIVLEWMPEEV